MAENDVSEFASALEDGGISSVEAPGAVVKSAAADSVDQMEPAVPINDSELASLRNEAKETRAAEDMFVDCPDEIETSESQQSSEEKDNLKDDQTNESDSRINVQEVVAEIEILRDKLEKSVSEKDHLALEYEKERAMIMGELTHLCNLLKVSNEQLISADENGDGFINHQEADVGSNTSLHAMISECSRFLKYAMDAHLKTQEKVRELHSAVYAKDQEIDFLNSKVAEFTESSNMAQSNLILEHDKLSQLYEVQLEKDQHIEEIADRTLALLAVHHQEELWDGSLTKKISNIEKSAAVVVEKYNRFVSGSKELKECLDGVGLDLNEIDEVGTLLIARDKILELGRKEVDMNQNLSSLEDENRKLVEELEKQKSTLENMNAEIGTLNAEVEREKNRYANTKEKLSMAVTKGKALVQQRDSLKQSLLEKTSQLENCSNELQEKASALEAAEKTNKLLAASERLVASLQESLAEKDSVLLKCEDILIECFASDEHRTTSIPEKLRWLADDNQSLKDITLQYHRLNDALSLIEFPETLGSSELDVRVQWLAESFRLSKEAAARLQSDIVETKEAAKMEIDNLTTSLLAEIQDKNYLEVELEDISRKRETSERLQHELAQARESINNEIERLTSSLLAESQEKSYLRLELENLRHKYDGVIEKENLTSLEKEKILSILFEASGIANGSQGEVHPVDTDIRSVIDTCLQKIKDQACPKDPSLEIEIFESLKSLLYIRDQEMTLYKLIMEEDMETRTQQLNTLKNEKVVMQKSLEQLEERCALLKEKLSMAVKKGKGLVQERENLKGSLNEKNTEIDSLKSELQQYISRYDESQDKVTKLLVDVERISLLETDLISANKNAVQLEQFLADSKNILHIVMESIEAITPTNLSLKEPIEKVKWLAGYLSEIEISKAHMEQELRNVKDEVSSLTSKFSENQTTIKSLEEALSVTENSRSELLDEKKALEVSKELLEEELQKEKETASSLTSEFEALLVRERALEDALSLAEDNNSRFTNERDVAVESRSFADEQIKKLTGELSDHVNKLADTEKTIQSLEDALSQAQKNISLLSDENSKVNSGRGDLEGEIKRIKEETDTYASKLSVASITIKSLEDAVLNAENSIADLVHGKKIAEKEIVALTSKLETCMEESAGIRSSLENQSLELSGQLSRLRVLLEDESLSTLVGQCFQNKFESLKRIDFLVQEMWDCFLDTDTDVLLKSPIMEDATLSTTSPFNSDVTANMKMLNDEVNVGTGSIIVQIENMVERFHLKVKTLADKFSSLSTFMDESISTQLKRLHVTKDKIIDATEYIHSLEDQLKDIHTDKQRQDDTMSSLESDIRILLSACKDATKELKLNVHKNLSELRSMHELVNLDGDLSLDLRAVEDVEASSLATDHVKEAEKLLLTTRQNQDLSVLFQHAISKLVSMTEDIHDKLKKSQQTYEEVVEERDLYKERILKLETDLITQQKLYHETEIKLEEYRERVDNLSKGETDLSTSSSEVHELEGTFTSSQVKSILNKINQVNIPDAALVLGDSHDSADVRKLFYVIDSFSESLKKVSSLSHENEELQSTIDQQILEIEQPKRQVEDYIDNERDSKKQKNLSEVESDLESIVRKLGGGDLMDDINVDGVTWLLSLLDKLVNARLLESESLKFKNEELGNKLSGAQKDVDDLLSKVKLLEESNQTKVVPPEIIQERETSISPLSTHSEISEMQEMGALGKNNNIPSGSSAAHVRTLRKGSNDHLAINIESESERLLNTKDRGSDEDKGHVFKSLIGSGLIPRQGRTAADRIDGIWVSSSRALMNHPRGRLGVITYCLVLHIWLLGTIL